MITILHGDNEPQVHAHVVEYMQAARKKNADVVRLDAKKIEITNLEIAIGTDALFAIEKTVVIDGLFSLPKSKRKDTLIEWLREHDTSEVFVILAEKKTLTATQLKSFPHAAAVVFKHPAILFQWLETFGTQPVAPSLEMLHKVLEREDAELAFIMLIRQVRILLSFVSDGVFDGPPFLRGKVASQARYFTKAKLLALHARLLELDEGQKTSKNTLTLAQNLDLLVAQL